MVTPSTFPLGNITEFGPVGGIRAIAREGSGWLFAYHWHRASAWDQAMAWAHGLGLEPLDDVPLMTIRTLDLYELRSSDN